MLSRRLRNRLLPSAALLTASLVAAACAESPAGPTPAGPRAALAATTTDTTASAETPVTVAGLRRSSALNATVTMSVTVSNDRGAAFDVPMTGLRVSVPAGALPSNSLTITVTSRPGSMVAYEFGPHGTNFLKPVVLTQSLKNTNYSKLADGAAVELGYFADRSQLDPTRNQAAVTELLPTQADVTKGTLSAQVTHFSGYLVSSGRL